MPSWSTRLLSGTSSVSSPLTTPTIPHIEEVIPSIQSSELRGRKNSITAKSDLQATISTGPSSGASPRHKPTRHGRSISHPFPSRPSSRNKLETRARGDLAEVDMEDLEHDEGMESESGPLHNIPQTFSHKGATQQMERDLVFGKCATCDSMVRWPRHLDVYRCSVCLMINDLKADHCAQPIYSNNSPHNLHNNTNNRVPRKVLPISLNRTKVLIDQCIDAYLQRSSDGKMHSYDLGNPVSSREGMSILSHQSPLAQPSRSPPLPPLSTGPETSSPLPPPNKETQMEQIKYVFKPLEIYLLASLQDCACLNASFTISRPGLPVRAASEGTMLKNTNPVLSTSMDSNISLSEVDAKTLLLGDVAENGLWWTGNRTDRQRSHQSTVNGNLGSERVDGKMSSRSSRINFVELEEWYRAIESCGQSWRDNWRRLQRIMHPDKLISNKPLDNEQRIESDLAEARMHVHRVFWKATESLLRRPGRPLRFPGDCRFLLIFLTNPLLWTTFSKNESSTISDLYPSKMSSIHFQQSHLLSTDKTLPAGSVSGQHSGIIKRILGLMANLSVECHQTLITWICRLAEPPFRRIVELVGGFVTYRLTRQSGRIRSQSLDLIASLIPNISGPGAGTSAHLHAALGMAGTSKRVRARGKIVTYNDDWQIKAAAKVMSLLFSANNSSFHRRTGVWASHNDLARQRAHTHAQLLPASEFYNTLLDYADLTADFEAWESRMGKFTFCQYPMFLSIWAKIHILEHDTRRQMEVKAREAFFNSIINRKAISQYLVLKVRRECLVDDSLRRVSEVVGTGQEEIKKSLRIEFMGEEGVDAGGLRKEWFLLLVREVFDPEHGLFIYDEDSHYCYFNPNSFEASDQFFLVGVVLGLAIYNSTILDVALPPFAFRKLLGSAPSYTGLAMSAFRPFIGYTVDDLEEFRPALAKGFRQLLQFEGNVEETFCRDFVAEVESYGQVVRVPLCPNGENRPVTNNNRREFVDLYIHYLLDSAVVRQFEPLKRGFFTVCGGNALSLFRPEEIELLVRGSGEPLDIRSLRAVAIYENWKAEQESTITWFWETFESADIKFQRRILGFITGSDRIPAMGATSLVIKVACLGDDHERFPIARTCFNLIGLHRHLTKQEFQVKFYGAILESEGFGLK